MPRKPRLWFPEALCHLTIRGNNREPIFFVERDYTKYLHLLKTAKRQYNCYVFAYALMTNHVHLMVQTGQVHSVSKFMQWINTSYTVYLNKKYNRVGHIFQGRFHSTVVEKDSYALELTRYIHLNPVRAGMAQIPERYRWSSYRAYAGLDEDDVVDVKMILEMISPLESERRRRYEEFVRDGLAMHTLSFERQLQQANGILGSADFFHRVMEGARPHAQKSEFFPIGV